MIQEVYIEMFQLEIRRMDLETKGGFYITQIKQLQDRIFERLLLENGIEISGGQGRILYIL